MLYLYPVYDLAEIGRNRMMYPSYLFGRVGSVDDTTGLFALEGGLSDFKIDRRVIGQVASTRDGYEINSRLPFEDGQENPNVQFFNKLECHCLDPQEWGGDIYSFIRSKTARKGAEKLVDLADAPQSLIHTFNTTRIADRRYTNEVVGIVPESRVIKTILRAKGVATKRIILFGASVNPEDGGALWIVSPHGFPWRDTKKHILDEGSDEDLENCLKTKNFLFMGLTGSVPFISGHRQRQPDEEWPRILRIPSSVEVKEYCKMLDSHIAGVVEGEVKTLGPSVDFMIDLYLKAKASGKAAITPEDLLSEGTIILSDSDMML
jgi:hypothetical protein